MPTLKYYIAEGPPRLYSIHKALTTIGKAADNDLVITGTNALANHVRINFDGRDFLIEEIERSGQMTINGKKKRRARLVHGDRVVLTGAEIGFSMFAEGLKRARKDAPSDGAVTTRSATTA